MREETVQADMTVVGGGLAGICAAIAAARLGRSVALVHNRPVLGGNSSSEVRVWVCGATGHGVQRYARESGIMGELFVENQYRNPEGNPYIWDLVLLEAVKEEKNIRLFLNTDVHEVEASGSEDDRRIDAVTGWMMGSERRIRFLSGMYLDCTGDGLIGFLAGAKFRLGREARSEYNEEWAPDAADGITLGSTILFYTKDAGQPVRYQAPSFAKDIAKTSIPLKRVIRSGDSGCHYWWIEWGGELDTVHENERIRDELWAVIYGIWDYIKNSGQFDADHLTLEWVGALPGKREYRRFIGDYVLNQNDILAQTLFEDRIGFGGWSIDLHPPQGMYSTESGSKHLHSDGVYHIPFRSLYSVNTSNLMFAGRNISASHVAFGTTRVMATCAVLGEAAGTGAALCSKLGIAPRELYHTRLAELQQTMLRQDASVLGVRNEDAADLALRAKVTASSELRRLAVEQSDETFELKSDIGLLFPIDDEVQNVQLLVSAAADTCLEVELWDTGRAENYVPCRLQAQSATAVPNGDKVWVTVRLPWRPETPQNGFLIVKANEHVCLHVSHTPLTGVLSFIKGERPIVSADLEDHQPDQPIVQWSMKSLVRKPFCFRLDGDSGAYAASQAVNGYKRPYGGPNLWMSERLQQGDEVYVELTWDEPVVLSEVRLTFNDDCNEDLINLHHHRTPFDIIPELVKDYRIECAGQDGQWKLLHTEQSNRRRTRRHKLPQPVETDKLHLVVTATNGSPFAELVEIRVYE
ncbi:FAD-dependent oxidoreductase [Paenibacillus thalictri]|uniref:FAD-dependent oxidoreductase n=1 Tax=Paenibacillus thalictri TaxID=2527873 RepID=A0A4Q9DST3_9BACL|nr:FAD-dependent oxidoreductase [Paenibacillus thalictri]TBL78549.1 FAD-dependent oxidoreductase [Paenibacillus thalictri]